MKTSRGSICIVIALIAAAAPAAAPGDEAASPPEPYAEAALAVEGMV